MQWSLHVTPLACWAFELQCVRGLPCLCMGGLPLLRWMHQTQRVFVRRVHHSTLPGVDVKAFGWPPWLRTPASNKPETLVIAVQAVRVPQADCIPSH